MTAITTEFFSIASYDWTGSAYSILETSSASLTVTPTPGGVTNENLALADPTVGSFSDLTVQMQATHPIPEDGSIQITFPKWNSFASSPSLY